MIKEMIIWQNGMVMALDEKGKQMPEYQGHCSELLDKIEQLPETVQFYLGEWRSGVKDPCDKSYFIESCKRKKPGDKPVNF